MFRKVACILVLSLTASHAPAKNRKQNPKPPVVALRNMNGPTRTTGEGTATPSGLKYWDLQLGMGSPATKGKAVKIHCTGWLESGKKFESSIDKGQPIIFLLGTDGVIKGWNEGIEGMKVGGKRQLWVPSYLAYGPRGSELVPPNSNLIFDIEVVGVQ
jgi:FKBP-type peptidyl-prolyl cis-trans isomerase